MKQILILLSIFYSIVSFAQQSNDRIEDPDKWITTMDFVEVLDGHQQEALHYYDHNWKVLRKMALAKDYIAGYQLLITPVSKDIKIFFT